MKKGQRIVRHYNTPSEVVTGFLSDIYKMMTSQSLHTNFRIIVITSESVKFTNALLSNAVRYVYNEFLSIYVPVILIGN